MARLLAPSNRTIWIGEVRADGGTAYWIALA